MITQCNELYNIYKPTHCIHFPCLLNFSFYFCFFLVAILEVVAFSPYLVLPVKKEFYMTLYHLVQFTQRYVTCIIKTLTLPFLLICGDHDGDRDGDLDFGLGLSTSRLSVEALLLDVIHEFLMAGLTWIPK